MYKLLKLKIKILTFIYNESLSKITINITINNTIKITIKIRIKLQYNQNKITIKIVRIIYKRDLTIKNNILKININKSLKYHKNTNLKY